MLQFLKRTGLGIQHYRSAINFCRASSPNISNSFVRFASSNFNDPDASKPTLDIEPFKKSERLHRPISPHLTIYQPQLTWLLSSAHRITGAGVGALFYCTAWAYAIVPIDTTSLVLSLHSSPFAIIFLAKTILGFPIFFHSFNGIRHLIWDTANALTMEGVYFTGKVTLVLSAVATAIFAFL